MSDESERSDDQVLSVYKTILNCSRRRTGHPGMDAFTERSLFAAHQTLARRGLPRDPEDTYNPDEFAGYSSCVAGGLTLRELLPDDELFRAFLEFAWKVRNDAKNSGRDWREDPAVDGVVAVLEPVAEHLRELDSGVLASHHLERGHTNLRIRGEDMMAAYFNFLDQPGP